MNTTKKVNLIRYSGKITATLALLLAFYQIYQGELIDSLQPVGLFLGAMAFAIEPKAFIVSPIDSRTTLAEISSVQKLFIGAALLSALLTFFVMYISGMMEIMRATLNN